MLVSGIAVEAVVVVHILLHDVEDILVQGVVETGILVLEIDVSSETEEEVVVDTVQSDHDNLPCDQQDLKDKKSSWKVQEEHEEPEVVVGGVGFDNH